MTKSDRLVKFMSHPSAYAERPRRVEVVETHISWVFLTDQFAYKLKKPVKFDFVDFSTPALRHQACLDELRLNRRLAPDVYLAVVPVVEREDGAFRLSAQGREIDWVVQMRRLPAAKALDRLMRADQLGTDDAKTVAQFLAEFYIRLPAEPIQPDDYRQALDRHIRSNRTALLELLPDEEVRLRRIHCSQLRYLHIERAVFVDRVLAGRIVDGHGDLRPEHIYIERPPAVIDCLEFSDELRRVDTADELSFLAMECERVGRADVGELALSTYEQVCNDPIPKALISFYQSYRACVRAKVSLLHGQQQSESQRRSMTRLARQYLDWADHDARELGRPWLLVVFGLMGSGKSTLARTISETFEADVLSTDSIRRSMLGVSASPADYGEGMYRPATRRQVYDELLREASTILDTGQSVIVDGAFLTRELREGVKKLASRHGAEVANILCDCPRETALARIERRTLAGHSESEARADLYDSQLGEFEPPLDGEATIRVDTTVNIAAQFDVVCEALRHLLANGARANGDVCGSLIRKRMS